MNAHEALEIVNTLISERKALDCCADVLSIVAEHQQIVANLQREAEGIDGSLMAKRQELAALDEQVRARQERVSERLAMIEQDARERKKAIQAELAVKQEALDNWHVTAKNEEATKQDALAMIQARIEEARQELQGLHAQVSHAKHERAALAAALGG